MRIMQDVYRIVDGLTYKPGHQIKVGDRPYSGIPGHCLMIQTDRVSDSRGEAKFNSLMFVVDIREAALAEMNDDKDILEFVREAVHKWELHEADEWLKYHDKQVSNPHGSVA